MKNLVLSILAFVLFTSVAFSNAALVVDAGTKKCAQLISTTVDVQVENQVAITTSTQIFINNSAEEISPILAFPLPTTASVISIRWKYDTSWKTATIVSSPQDSSLPSGSGNIDANLKKYLGNSPLFFNPKEKIAVEASIQIEITYVELLHYDLGEVKYTYLNDYSLIQDVNVDKQIFKFTLKSKRTVDDIDLDDIATAQISNDGNNADISNQILNDAAKQNYNVIYKLNSSELGLFGFTTYKDSVPDKYSRGFFTFVAEPDQSENTATISKVFTLVIDRSGSMGGDKMLQAINAANFIVNNLNEGDMFNVIAYDDIIEPIFNSHLPFNIENKTIATNFISGLYARGSTNISGAMLTALGQYPPHTGETANIIIFFTDGQATAGITGTPELLSAIKSANKDKKIIIFPFGVGSDVNKTLLSVMAQENGGIADFLLNEDFEKKITKFYLTVRNPVLLEPQISFEPNVVSEVYPRVLPNLYKGQQMIVSGRYNEPVDSLYITLTGTAFGEELSYTYPLSLANQDIPNLSFLPKVWAKMKIEDLLLMYYKYYEYSNKAKNIKDSITTISLQYQIMTIFTSFKNEDNGGSTSVYSEYLESNYEMKAMAYPNPFTNSTTITLDKQYLTEQTYELAIYDYDGKLINSFDVAADLLIKGFAWNGRDFNNNQLENGLYLCVIKSDNSIYAVQIIKE
jgi:Ca-activated chloride channel family protein